MIDEPMQQTVFKILFGGKEGLGLVKIIGDRFLIAPFFQERDSFEICNWRILDQEALSKELSSRFGMWGGDIQPNSYVNGGVKVGHCSGGLLLSRAV